MSVMWGRNLPGAMSGELSDSGTWFDKNDYHGSFSEPRRNMIEKIKSGGYEANKDGEVIFVPGWVDSANDWSAWTRRMEASRIHNQKYPGFDKLGIFMILKRKGVNYGR